MRASLIFRDPNHLPYWATNRQTRPLFYDGGVAIAFSCTFLPSFLFPSVLFFFLTYFISMCTFICLPYAKRKGTERRRTSDRCGLHILGAARRPPPPFACRLCVKGSDRCGKRGVFEKTKRRLPLGKKQEPGERSANTPRR